MSWRAVEMQIALPRTQDAGKIQEQIQQRGQFMQDVIANQQLAQDEMKRKTVNDLKQKAMLSNKREEKHQTALETENGNTSNKTIESHAIAHPYLGKQIDFNG